MGAYFFVTQILIILTISYVTSFTITSKHDGDTDLARAVAVLNRQRRRSTETYLNPDHLLRGGEISVNDVQDWLTASNMDDERHDLNTDIFLNSGLRYKDVDRFLKEYNFSNKQPLIVSSAKPSSEEMNDIFNTRDIDESSLVPKAISDWFLKTKMADDARTNKYIEKKANSPTITKTNVGSNDNLSLITLTEDEFRALMKAIDKLRKQSEKFVEKTTETPDMTSAFGEIFEEIQEPKLGTIVQNVKEEELKLTRDGVGSPVLKETEVISENEPDVSEQRVMEKQAGSRLLSEDEEKEEDEEATRKPDLDLVNELTSALEDNVGASERKGTNGNIKNEIKKINRNKNIDQSASEWNIQKHQQNNLLVKRNKNRPVAVLSPLLKDLVDDDNDDDGDDDDGGDDNVIEPPRLEEFMAKILKLQNEVDRLKLVSRLAGLENDVLTDALNEATLGQEEDSVTDLEFESLKEAVTIEEALQDLRRSRNNRQNQVGVSERGQQHWRQKRGLSFRERGLVRGDARPLYPPISLLSRGKKASKEDMRRLLGQTYLMKEQESKEFGPK